MPQKSYFEQTSNKEKEIPEINLFTAEQMARVATLRLFGIRNYKGQVLRIQ
jgi:hypothetical protein